MIIALKELFSFVNIDFMDLDLCRVDFMHSHLKLLYANADILSNRPNELRLIIEASYQEVLSINTCFVVSKSVFLSGWLPVVLEL